MKGTGMASAAEQMAANLSWSAFGKATELRQRILFAIGLLIIYRLGTFIPVPGIDAIALREFVETASTGIGGILSMFTGGAISRMAIFALGIMPYISASIIVQLMTAMVPQLEALKKEVPEERRPTPEQLESVWPDDHERRFGLGYPYLLEWELYSSQEQKELKNLQADLDRLAEDSKRYFQLEAQIKLWQGAKQP